MEKIYKFKLETKGIDKHDIKHYPISKDIKENDILMLSSNKKDIKIGVLIGSKGEGKVFEVNEHIVAKVFHEDRFNESKLMKIHKLISGAKKDSSISYPIDFLLDEKEIVGYIMPKAKGVSLQTLFKPSNLKSNFPNWRLSDLLTLCLSITISIKKIHDQNLIIGDLNASNILVQNSNSITIIDTDSFQVENYPAEVGMIEYTRDIHFEHLSSEGGYKNVLKTKFDDLFGLSIAIFQILHTGQLPFNHIGGEESYQQNIIKSHFPYSCDSTQKLDTTPNGSYRQWNMLPQPLKIYFCDIFKYKKLICLKDLEQALVNSISPLIYK